MKTSSLKWAAVASFVVSRLWKGGSEGYSALVRFYTCSAIMVVFFFGFGFFYGHGTSLTVADYWRWFVVHISAFGRP